jgi:cytochrome bd ubiquinol oxidase subunit I
VMTTAQGVSPSVSAFDVWVSMTLLTLLYAVLAVIEVKLLLTTIKAGLPEDAPPADDADDVDRPLAFAY